MTAQMTVAAMIVKHPDFGAFMQQSTAQHEPGISAAGKRYKQYSHSALTEVFDQLIDRLNVTSAIEIGAFKADFSQRFTRNNTQRTALAVEANPYNFEAFKKTLAAAGVHYHHAAIQDQTGTCTLQLSVTDRDVKNGYIRGNNSILSASARPETQPLTVPATTLDVLVADYVAAGKLADPALSPPVLWIDVEGALNLVIAGGHETIKQSLAIFTEVEATELWDDQVIFPQICAELEELGFNPFLRDCEYEPDQFNVLFVHQDLHKEPLLEELASWYSQALISFK